MQSNQPKGVIMTLPQTTTLQDLKAKEFLSPEEVYNAPKISDNKLQEDLSTWIEYEEIKKEGKYHEQETQKL